MRSWCWFFSGTHALGLAVAPVASVLKSEITPSLARMSNDDSPHTKAGSPFVTESSTRALIREELRAILPNPTASMAPTTSVVNSTSPHSSKPNHKAHVLPLPLVRHSPLMQSVSISVISITIHYTMMNVFGNICM